MMTLRPTVSLTRLPLMIMTFAGRRTTLDTQLDRLAQARGNEVGFRAFP
jgi:hypothetical protein